MRCRSIERRKRGDADTGPKETLETRNYDDAGRLASVETAQLAGSSDALRMPCAWITTTYAYDAQDRLERSVRKASPNHGCGDKPYRTVSYAYDADGGVRIETFDYATDVGIETLTVDGEEVYAARSVETRTPGCQWIDDQIGADPSAQCRIF